MPAIKCDNGKWKWGETGECKYDSQEEAEKDNEDYYEASTENREINKLNPKGKPPINPRTGRRDGGA